MDAEKATLRSLNLTLQNYVDCRGHAFPIVLVGLVAHYIEDRVNDRSGLHRAVRFHDRHRLEPDFAVGHHPQSLRARTRLGQSISIKELPTRIVSIDLSNEDESTSNRRVECIRCALGDLVELRPEPKNPDGENAIALWSDRGV